MPHAACHDDKCQNATQVDTADLTHLNWHDLRKRSCLPCLATPPSTVTSATVANSSDIQQATAPLQKGNDKQQPKEQRQDADSRRMAWRGKGGAMGAGRGRRALRLGPKSGAAEGRRMSPCQSCHPRRRRRRCRLLCMQSVE